MINFQVFGLCHALLLLSREEDGAQLRQGIINPERITAEVVKRVTGSQEYAPQDAERIKGLLEYWQRIADQLHMQNTQSRLGRFRLKLRSNMSLAEAHPAVPG